MSDELDLSDFDPVEAKAPAKTGTYRYTLKDGTVIQLPTPKLSVTQVTMYMKCPAQYEQRYVLGKKDPPGIALVEGSSNHAALEFQNAYQIVHGEPARLKKVLEHFGDDLSTRAKEVPNVEWRRAGETRDSVFHRGVGLLTTYMKTTVKEFKPVAAEQGFDILVQGVPFQGFIDLAEDGALWDYKVVSKSSFSKYKRGIDHDFQLTAYAYATGITRVGFVPLVKDSGEIHVLRSKRTKPNLKGFEYVVDRVARAISKGAFPLCMPDSWWCNARFCGYYKEDCRGKFE